MIQNFNKKQKELQEICEKAEIERVNNNLGGAKDYYLQVLKIDPKCINANFGLAVVYHQNKEMSDAISYYNKVIEYLPELPEPYSNLAIIYEELGKHHLAVEYYQKAIEVNPSFSLAHNNLGVLYASVGNLEVAKKHYNNALTKNPSYADAHNNLGNAMLRSNQLPEALEHYQQAIKLNNKKAKFYFNLANTYKEMNEIDNAIDTYKQALTLDPKYHDARTNLYYLYMQNCDWLLAQNMEAELIAGNAQAIKDGIFQTEHPLANITRTDNLVENYQVAQAESKRIAKHYANINTISLKPLTSNPQKITIGYLSNDFYDHATMQLMQDIFSNHDRDTFKIHIYSYTLKQEDQFTQQLINTCDKFQDISNFGTEDAARLINYDHVDILIDLKGHTKGSRLEILALKPAPIQITYLGFPGTTGADFIDYAIVDIIVAPVKMAPYYSEKLLYLPHCYQPNSALKISDNNKSRFGKASVGLPVDAFVFCSFNQSCKLDPVMFKIWMKILHAVQNSVLWLLEDMPRVKNNLQQIASEHKINPERLIFAPKVNHQSHMERIKIADLCLDTRIYNGHTTTSDAIRAGVPVITLQGKHFASRVSSSILHSVGLQDLVTQSLEDYYDLACMLATNKHCLEDFKLQILKNKFTTPLFNSKQFTKDLEKLYKQAYEEKVIDNA